MHLDYIINSLLFRIWLIPAEYVVTHMDQWMELMPRGFLN